MDAEPNLGLPPYLREPGSRPRRSSTRRRQRPRSERRPRKRVWFPLLALIFLSPAIYSWIQMARLPSSESIFPRTVEWIRLRPGGNWVVNEVEYYYDTWFKTPVKYTQATPSSIHNATGHVFLVAEVVGPVEHRGGAVRFQVKDVSGGKRARLSIDYSGTVPKRFGAGQDIALKGSVSNGAFTATAGSLQTVERGNQAQKHHHTKSYVPPDIKPVFTYHLPGEGVWTPSGPPVDGGPPVLTTTFRPELAYPQIVAYLAWFDHTRTASAYYPGRYEPPNGSLRGPMEVPLGQRPRLLATFNGGFIYADGYNGDALDGHTNEPLKRGLATVVAYTNGAVNIISWQRGPTAGPKIAWARQSLPLIIDNGQLNPKLSLGTEWGFTLGNSVRVWRTGLGIDRHGNLIYVAANDQTVITLAEILKRAGAVRAMELDINPEWYTLITYRHQHHQIVPTQVAYNYQQPSTRYLSPDDRDFFAIYRRLPGAVTVPLQ